MSRAVPKSWMSDLLWNRLAEKNRKKLIDQINPIDGKYQVNLNTTIEKTQLPFYPDNFRLLRLSDSNWKSNLRIYYLEKQENLFRLNGTSPPIHEVNAKAPIQLSESNVMTYLRFFLFFVRGKEGPFLIFESLSQPEIPTIANAKDRTTLEKNAYPARFNGIDTDKHFLAAGMVWHGNGVFAAHFKIQPTGMVEMIEDEYVDSLDTKLEVPLS